VFDQRRLTKKEKVRFGGVDGICFCVYVYVPVAKEFVLSFRAGDKCCYY
jgi:hypothetical protein